MKAQQIVPLQSQRQDTSRMNIQFVDLRAQFEPIRGEITEAVMRTLESQRFILGPEVEAFEREIAAWNGSDAAIACASGSDALLLALMTLGIGPGDEVITTAFTFVSTATAIARLGATPVFVDIDPQTFNLDPGKVEEAVTARTKAIVPVHLFGLSADLNPICAFAHGKGIPLIEDAAQAIGAKYQGQRVGNRGLMNCFSFFPAKNLGAAGDGGLITTNDRELADRIRLLANHGSRARYSYETIGINSRLDALQAAILRVKLLHLEDWTGKRRRNASHFVKRFSEERLAEHVTAPVEPAYAFHVYNQFTIRCRQRDELRMFLSSSGISTQIYYPHPLHLEPAFAYLDYRAGDLPESERAAKDVLSLPVYAELPAEHVEAVVDQIAEFYRSE